MEVNLNLVARWRVHTNKSFIYHNQTSFQFPPLYIKYLPLRAYRSEVLADCQYFYRKNSVMTPDSVRRVRRTETYPAVVSSARVKYH